jgi:aminopeptidase N
VRKIIFILFLGLGLEVYGQVFCSRHARQDFVSSMASPFFSELQNYYDVKYYNIAIEVNDTSSVFKARTEVVFTAKIEIDTLVFELQESIEADSLFVNGTLIDSVRHADGLIYAFLSEALPPGSDNSFELLYRGGGQEGGFFSGITNRRDFTYGKSVTYTLSEPFQSSSWFPVKQSLNDKADSVRVEIITDPDLMGGSNGLLKEVRMQEDGRVAYVWESQYPIAFYLISIAVADYIDYSFYVPLENSDSLLVQNFIYDHPEILTREKDRIDATGDMILFFNEIFGLYPFHQEKYGHSMAPMGGGMEHQTMTTLQTFNFDLVAHELAHQWFGDNVTCGTWQDIWINEGFASYSEYLAREFLQGRPQAISWMENAHGYALRAEKESVYLSEEEARDVSRIFNFALSYKKGAALLHMLRNEISNDQTFFNIFREFQLRYKDSFAVADDFSGIVNELTGEDYSWFFDQWYYGSGHPVMQAIWKLRADSLYINTFQGSSSNDPEFFRMHVDFLVDFADGSDTLLRVLIDEPEEKFSFELKKSMESIQIDPYSKNLMVATIYEYIPENSLVEVNPNPVRDILYLDFKNSGTSKSVFISDLQGKVMFDEDLGRVSSSELNLSNLAGGIYLMVIKEQNKRNALRIVKIN